MRCCERCASVIIASPSLSACSPAPCASTRLGNSPAIMSIQTTIIQYLQQLQGQTPHHKREALSSSCFNNSTATSRRKATSSIIALDQYVCASSFVQLSYHLFRS